MSEAPVALVTGGSRGIGAATARALAAAGYDVAVACHTGLDKAQAVVADIEAAGRRGLVLSGDVRTANDVAALVERTVADLGRLDAVVSAATGVPAGTPRGDLVPPGRTPSLDTGWSTYEEALSARPGALLGLAQAAVPHLLAGGSIVALTSLGSARVVPGYAVMGTAMAAVESLSRYLAVELAPRGIRVNVVSAGVVDTEALALVADDPEALRDHVSRRTPMRRMATPEDVADLVVAVVSDHLRWVTGQVLVADGGASLPA